MSDQRFSISDSARRAAQGARARLASGGSGGSGSTASGSRGSDSGASSAAQQQGLPPGMAEGRSCLRCPEWRYVMGIRKLGGIPAVYSWHHLFLIAWNRGGTGAMPTYSAFPSQPEGDPGAWGPLRGAATSDSSKPVTPQHQPDPADDSDMGYIKPAPVADFTRSGEYAPGNRYVVLRDQNPDLRADLDSHMQQIAEMRIRYVATGPNSNSFAMSLAERTGLPRRKPAGDAPGSDIKL